MFSYVWTPGQERDLVNEVVKMVEPVDGHSYSIPQVIH